MIDTHCHLDMVEFRDDLQGVIKRAIDAGVQKIINISSDFEGAKGALRLANEHEMIFCSLGMHPHHASEYTDEIQNWIRSNAETNPKVVAIGEIGLDYHYEHSPRDTQRAVFLRQLDLSRELNKPVIIHSREADDDMLAILQDFGAWQGVMHCYSSNLEFAHKVMQLGYYISFAGQVTFKKADTLRKVASAIPDERLLVETDAPYLAPEPYRGKRNEPAFVTITAKKIAELRGITYEDIDRIVTLNAHKVFNLPYSQSSQIAYKIRNNLYLNITNRCSNACVFCIRYHSDFVKGHNLKLDYEPSVKELIGAIGSPLKYDEIVFCGYGEPFKRLDVVVELSRWIKSQGAKVRINTNGHANAINQRNILPELKGIVDTFSISLNAHNETTYNTLCKPLLPNAYKEMLEFARLAVKDGFDVRLTVVSMPEVDIEKCRAIAEDIGAKFKVRTLGVVG